MVIPIEFLPLIFGSCEILSFQENGFWLALNLPKTIVADDPFALEQREYFGNICRRSLFGKFLTCLLCEIWTDQEVLSIRFLQQRGFRADNGVNSPNLIAYFPRNLEENICLCFHRFAQALALKKFSHYWGMMNSPLA